MPDENRSAPLASSSWEELDRVILAFEAAWQNGLNPEIESYLPAAGPERQKLLFELIYVDLERRLNSTSAHFERLRP